MLSSVVSGGAILHFIYAFIKFDSEPKFPYILFKHGVLLLIYFSCYQTNIEQFSSYYSIKSCMATAIFPILFTLLRTAI